MNFRMPEPGEGILLGGDVSQPYLAKIVDYLNPLGCHGCRTSGTPHGEHACPSWGTQSAARRRCLWRWTRLPEPGEGILLGGDVSQPYLAKIVDYLNPLGYKFFG
jgi:hypothetical protein